MQNKNDMPNTKKHAFKLFLECMNGLHESNHFLCCTNLKIVQNIFILHILLNRIEEHIDELLNNYDLDLSTIKVS